MTKGKRRFTKFTFSDIDDKGPWSWRCINPFARHVLHLQASVWRRLQKLIRHAVAITINEGRMQEVMKGKTYEREKPCVVMRTDALV